MAIERISLDLIKNKRILIIRLSSLGDIFLTTPLIRSIKNQNKSVSIDILLRKGYQDIFKFNPYIDRIFTYINYNYLDLMHELVDRNYDLVIDLQNNFRSARIRRIIGAKVFSFNKKSISKFFLVNFKINTLKTSPLIPQRYADSIPNFNLDNDGLDLFLPDKKGQELNTEENYIGIAPGSRHFTKMWLKEYYIELSKMLQYDGFKIVIFGGKSDKQLCEEISKEISGSVDLCNDDDILKTAENMRICKAIICNDSGLMHAASACGVPVLAIFGSSVKEFGFLPYKSKNLILTNNKITCRPCSHIGKSKCPKKHFNCMKELTPGIAYSKLKELLN